MFFYISQPILRAHWHLDHYRCRQLVLRSSHLRITRAHFWATGRLGPSLKDDYFSERLKWRGACMRRLIIDWRPPKNRYQWRADRQNRWGNDEKAWMKFLFVMSEPYFDQPIRKTSCIFRQRTTWIDASANWQEDGWRGEPHFQVLSSCWAN